MHRFIRRLILNIPILALAADSSIAANLCDALAPAAALSGAVNLHETTNAKSATAIIIVHAAMQKNRGDYLKILRDMAADTALRASLIGVLERMIREPQWLVPLEVSPAPGPLGGMLLGAGLAPEAFRIERPQVLRNNAIEVFGLLADSFPRQAGKVFESFLDGVVACAEHSENRREVYFTLARIVRTRWIQEHWLSTPLSENVIKLLVAAVNPKEQTPICESAIRALAHVRPQNWIIQGLQTMLNSPWNAAKLRISLAATIQTLVGRPTEGQDQIHLPGGDRALSDTSA